MHRVQRVVFLEHADGEGPARLGARCSLRGLELERVALYRGQALPARLDDALLVVLGGPMGVRDAAGPAFPFLASELALLEERVRRGLPTLGVCLGAQLLATAAGGSVSSLTDASGQPRFELGWHPVRLLGGPSEPLRARVGEELLAFHWHGDTYSLPPGARRLASSALCSEQLLELGPRLFGVQFHPEVDEQVILDWAESDPDAVRAALGPDGPERLVEDTRRLWPAAREPLERLLDTLLDALLAPLF